MKRFLIFLTLGISCVSIPKPEPKPEPSPEASPPQPPPENPQPPKADQDPLAGGCYKADVWICEVEKAIGELTNSYRQGEARPPLSFDPEASWVARDWSNQQAARGMISHQGFNSARNAAFQREFGKSIFFRAENVAYSSIRNQSPGQVAKMFVDMWWRSTGHRINMLGSYKFLGAGIAKRGNLVYATQLFHNGPNSRAAGIVPAAKHD